MLVLILMIAFSSWRGDSASSVLALVRPKPLSALGATHITCMISGGTSVVLMCQLILALDGDDQESSFQAGRALNKPVKSLNIKFEMSSDGLQKAFQKTIQSL